jgi:hypothetical protein
MSKHKGGVFLTKAEVAAYNTFFEICKTSSDPNVVAGFAVLQEALDDDEGSADQKHDPPGDEP